ncbi:hypothetical protein CHU95_06830 [Niveispirillum lacus]|uniref:Uncharacterized protein n=1 Tax=Niveispirillum lacus TaxID=1981099 RepID=A0A255Z369_9PROT|nr:hypothetical protein [Niveispirillum lacus]OYQ35963.1 hypothetical protein CHU95_06830 [Niveispirillum lacus]
MPPSAIHMDHVRARTQSPHHTAVEKPSGAESDKVEKGEGMSFWDVLDVVNPLQHIPGVNKIYQAITGDTIRTPAKVAGAALFFGPIGMAVASADAILEKETGKDATDHVASLLGLKKDSPAAAPAEDPFTVTAPRPARTASADTDMAPDVVPGTSMAAAAATKPGQPVDLSAGQAALLESLMGGGGQALPSASTGTAVPAAPKPTATAPSMAATATSISAKAPVAGGIANAQHLKDLETTPGASAALTAARGMGPAAIVASLPAPGAAGAGDNLLAAMEQEQQRAKNPNGGKGLAEYRAAAISSGSMGVKPVIPSRANQMVRAAGANMPDAAIPTQVTANRTLVPSAGATTSEPVVPAPAATDAPNSMAPASQPQAAWPPGGPAPLPKELIADMMTRVMDKYQAQGRSGAANGASTVH